jgi:hypothetical protein
VREKKNLKEPNSGIKEVGFFFLSREEARMDQQEIGEEMS